MKEDEKTLKMAQKRIETEPESVPHAQAWSSPCLGMSATRKCTHQMPGTPRREALGAQARKVRESDIVRCFDHNLSYAYPNEAILVSF